MAYQDRLLANININGQQINIVASKHAMERMEERQVDEFVVAGNVLALGKKRIAELHENNDEAIIIDKDKNVSIVIGFGKRNQITIITVIDRANVFVKKNTEICNI